MNFLMIIILFVFVWRIVIGYKRGMVKELQSFFTFLVSSASIALICKAINSYLNAETINVIIAVLLLIILSICFKILKLVFFSAKTIAKLPVIHLADKILGIVIGAAEVMLALWAFFLVLDVFAVGFFTRMLLAYVKDSAFLNYLYVNNLLESIFEQVSAAIQEII